MTVAIVDVLGAIERWADELAIREAILIHWLFNW